MPPPPPEQVSTSDFEQKVRDVTQLLLTTVNDRSLEVERRNGYANVLVAELDTQSHELLAAARALSVARRNCSFDVGIRRR
ncbi:hypothetical protein H4R20_003104 [Coemansia guatemalensis]|uniref:Uncharacterized protein n=1 Tax=Coemansia guatemalensis TaxID=2761395 RepID=A0A9W8I2I6_9FUNG|nr:hypothetical protein H4R20_003104 [Coemansia guatemalensis]